MADREKRIRRAKNEINIAIMYELEYFAKAIPDEASVVRPFARDAWAKAVVYCTMVDAASRCLWKARLAAFGTGSTEHSRTFNGGPYTILA